MKTRITEKCLLLVLLMVLWACQVHDEVPMEVQHETQRLVVSAAEIPEVTTTLLSKMGVRDALNEYSVNAGEGTLPFSIDWERIMQLIEPDGREVYTFNMTVSDADPRTFYNLVLRYSINKEAYNPIVYKYTMAEDFLPEYRASGSLEGFRGTVRKILLKGSLGGDRRGSAFIDGDGLVFGEECPNESSVGDNPGGGTNPDPTNPSITWECTTYIKLTPWYTHVCDVDGCGESTFLEYRESFVTECGWTEEGGTINIDDPCENEDGEVPIIDPDLIEEIPGIDNKLIDPCLKSIVSKASSNVLDGPLVNKLKAALGLLGEDGFSIEIVQDESLRGSTVDASTRKANDYIIEIVVNPELANSAAEYIAVSIYHEYMHAIWDIYSLMKDTHDPSFNHPDLTSIAGYLNSGRSETWAHHELMYQEYMQDFRSAVSALYPGTSAIDLEALTLHGIKPLTVNQKSTNDAYRNGNEGTECIEN